MLPLLAIASLVSGGISAFQGLSQKSQGKKMAALNPYPDQQIPQAILDNQELAKQQANVGLPSQQYQQAEKNINRNSVAALRGATDRRGGLGMVSTIQQGANDAKLGLDVADANARQQNQQQLMQQNNVMGQYQNNVWDWNKRQKYIQTAASARSLMGAGNANLNVGLDRALGGLLQSGIGGGNPKVSGDNDYSLARASTVQGYTPSGNTRMPSAPQQFMGNNNTMNALMAGGRMLGANQIPSQGANVRQPFVPKDYSNYDWLSGK